jgi:hypothetical protein
MNRPTYEMQVLTTEAGPQSPPGAGRVGMWLAVLGGTAFLALVSWAIDRQLGKFLSELDQDALQQSTQMLDRVIDQQRSQLASEVSVLADDTRIRSTVLAPVFDETTVKDVLEDLRRSSGANAMAVLDGGGKVRAVTGADGLVGVNLGSSSVFRAALERPATDVWTLPDQVRIIAISRIRSGEQVPALLVKGMTLGEAQLGAVQRTLGVAGAVFIGDRMTASSTNDPGWNEAFRVASRIPDEGVRFVESGPGYLGRLTRTSSAATAGRVVWLVRHHHQIERVRVLSVLVWAPVLFGGLLLLLVAMFRRPR